MLPLDWWSVSTQGTDSQIYSTHTIIVLMYQIRLSGTDVAPFCSAVFPNSTHYKTRGLKIYKAIHNKTNNQGNWKQEPNTVIMMQGNSNSLSWVKLLVSSVIRSMIFQEFVCENMLLVRNQTYFQLLIIFHIIKFWQHIGQLFVKRTLNLLVIICHINQVGWDFFKNCSNFINLIDNYKWPYRINIDYYCY